MGRKTVTMSGNTRMRKRRRHQNLPSQLLLPQKQSPKFRPKKNLNQQQKSRPDAERGPSLSQSLNQSRPEERGWADQTGTIFLNK